jgi:hypothetical protein
MIHGCLLRVQKCKRIRIREAYPTDRAGSRCGAHRCCQRLFERFCPRLDGQGIDTGFITLEMKTLIMTVMVTIFAATVPFDMTLGQTEPDQKVSDVRAGLLARFQKDLPRDDLEYVKSCLEREGLSWNDTARVTRLDFGRSRQAWLVEGLGPCLAGNANGLKHLYIRVGDGWREILDDVAQSLEVCAEAVPPCPASKPRSPGTHGWPDLALWHHGSASEGEQHVYRFNGNVYKEVFCNHVNYQSPDGKSYSQPRSIPCDVPSDFVAVLQNDLEYKTVNRR